MSRIHFTSDNHFGHANIIKYCNRPYSSVEKMNEGLIENWNVVVAKDDTVYCLGDFAFNSMKLINDTLDRLNGYKFLILGNHDGAIEDNRQSLFVNKRFGWIGHYKEITVEGQKIILHHFGYRVWHKNHQGSWALYGHSHGTLPPYGKSVDVGIDSPWVTGKAEHRPFSFAEIKAFMDKRPVEIADGHVNRQ